MLVGGSHACARGGRGEEEERLRLEAEVAAKLLTGAEERLRKATDAGDDEAELGGALEQAQAVGVSVGPQAIGHIEPSAALLYQVRPPCALRMEAAPQPHPPSHDHHECALPARSRRRSRCCSTLCAGASRWRSRTCTWRWIC